MSRTVIALYRYPVKGLSAESLASVQLQRGCALAHDRQFAIAHCHSKYQPQQPAWVARRNFTVLAYSPAIARVVSHFDAARRCITLVLDQQTFEIFVDHADVNQQLNNAMQVLDTDSQPGPYTLAEVQHGALTDSPAPLISLMNTRSLHDLQEKTGHELSPQRFRGNVWFDGDSAWEERLWPGRVMLLGNLQIKVIEQIIRCAAIDVHPTEGLRDIALLRKLNGIYGHSHFGVLAEVLQSGRLAVGDTLTGDQSNHVGSLGI
ncbi:MAG: MOSC domain-containing protein [Pseudomonadota bacterium]